MANYTNGHKIISVRRQSTAIKTFSLSIAKFYTCIIVITYRNLLHPHRLQNICSTYISTKTRCVFTYMLSAYITPKLRKIKIYGFAFISTDLGSSLLTE